MASTGNALAEGISGAIAAMTALAATYPLMTWTTRKQTSRNHKLTKKHPYSGLPLALFGASVSQGVYFTLYALFRDRAITKKIKRLDLPRNRISLTTGEALLVASLAGAGNVLLTNPIWVLVTKLQVQGTRKDEKLEGTMEETPVKDTFVGGTEGNKSTFQILMDVLKGEGVLGLWKGVLPNLIMVVNPTLQYALYERILHLRKRGRSLGPKTPNATTTFMDSMAAKLGATLLTYPILTVKARLQEQGKHTPPEQRYLGTIDAVQRIYVEEGPKAFYEGIGTKCVQSMTAAAILQTVKDEVVKATKSVL